MEVWRRLRGHSQRLKALRCWRFAAAYGGLRRPTFGRFTTVYCGLWRAETGPLAPSQFGAVGGA
eukprot:13535805-Alexandrium_andersonii.AAC.1